MSPEIYWLTLTVIFTSMMLIPYAIYRTVKIGGFWQVLMNPLPGDNPFDDEWAHRTYRAHMNAFEGLILFAPLAISVAVTGMGNETTALASAIYFWSRVIYTPLYYFKVPFFRTAVWFVGFSATLVLAFEML